MSGQQLRVQRKLRYDHDVRVALHLKTGHIAGAERERNLLRRGESLHHKAVMGGEHPGESSVVTAFEILERDPDRVDAVRVLDADVAGDRILATRNDERVLDRKRYARRARTLSLPETGAREQQDQRP